MKKSSSIRKANYRRTSLIKRHAPLILGCLLLLGLFFIVPTVSRVIAKVAWYPFDTLRVWIAESGSSLPQYLRDRSSLVAELNDLKMKAAVEQGNENTITKLQVENNEFRRLAGAVPENRILARVVGRPNNLPYDLIMLDRGSQHGVVEQAPVFLGTDQVVGFVTKVHDQTSLVVLVTTPNFISSAYVVGPNIYTFAEGMGGGILRVRVPQGILLQKNDLVLLPAIDSGVYGTISEIETSPTQPEQYGYLTTEVPLQSLYYVSIGKEAIQTNDFASAEKVVEAVTSQFFIVDLPPGVLVTPETGTTSTSTIENGTALATSTADSNPQN